MNARSDSRFLIVNADDFGLTSGINRGIIEAHEHGIVTSASLMVRYPAAQAAASYARTNERLSVGLHFDIAEWRYRNGEWKAAYEVIDAHDAAAVAAELDRQLEIFARLMKREPTHIDSHQHVHRVEPVLAVVLAAAERLHVPLRDVTGVVRYCGNFFGQTAEGQSYSAGISIVQLHEIIGQLETGWTELGCHPGYADGLDSVYLREREEEIRVLCSAEIAAVIEANGVRLSSFGDFRDTQSGKN